MSRFETGVEVCLTALMMYIHRMIRTQLYLDESIHRHLQNLARRQRRTISDLVREALTRVYGLGSDDRAATLRAIEGLWRDRKDIPDTNAYVRQLRRATHRLPRPRKSRGSSSTPTSSSRSFVDARGS